MLDVTARVITNALFLFRLRNGKDLEAVLEENIAIADKDKLLRLYDHHTRQKYSFLYIDSMHSDPDLVFFKIFDARLMITDP